MELPRGNFAKFTEGDGKFPEAEPRGICRDFAENYRDSVPFFEVLLKQKVLTQGISRYFYKY